MPLHNPKAGYSDAGNYLVPGIPWVRELPAMSGVQRVVFPAVTDFVNVKNATSGSASVLQVGFTQAGVVSGPQRFVLGNGMEKNIEVRCTEIWLRAASGTPDVNVVVGLTPILFDQAPVLTGSVNGVAQPLFGGVG